MSLGTIDRPIVATGEFVEHLPFGTGQALDAHNRAVNAIIGNWQVVSVFTFSTGYGYTTPAGPLSVTASCTGYGIIDASCYPNIVAGCTTAWMSGVPAPGTGGLNPATTHYLNAACFSNPAAGTYGDATRTAPLGLFAPNTWDLDLSIRREFPIGEKMRFALQADAFNILNVVTFAAPVVGNFAASSFGTITTQANAPRKLQISARFSF
jgi:hypothetical protein